MMRGVSKLAASVVAASIIVPAAATAGGLKPEKKAETARELAVSPHAELERVEIEIADIRRTRPERRAVSDLHIDLMAVGGEAIADALALPNGRPAAGNRKASFRARVMVVSGGRLYRDARAACSAWDGDISVCQVDCEGGRFGLKRVRGALRLMLGNLPREIDLASKPGFALASCGSEDGGESRLVPKIGRPLVELSLAGE